MSMTLIEASKAVQGDDLRATVIELYASKSQLLMVLPFEDIEGNALKYNQEEALPGIGFRGVNEGYDESTGVLNPIVEPLVIAGGDLDVDMFIIDRQGEGIRAQQETMKIKALAHKWTHTFIKGDTTINQKEFDGLQVRITGAQLIANGSTSGGDPLSLAKLDETIDACDEPTHIILNKTMARRFAAAARTETVGGNVTYTVDEFGRRVTEYNALPFIIVGDNGDVYDTLAFSEVGPNGGGSTSTSVYVVSLKDGMLTGIQGGTIDVRDLGELETKPAMRTRVEWYSGIALWHPRAVARLWGISNAAIAA